MSTTNLHDNIILNKKDLKKEFEKGCKCKSDFKIGIEYERLLVNKQSSQTIPYYGENGIYRFLRQIAFKDEWSYLTDFGQVVGLKKGNTTISLEPGGQFEISLEPKNSVKEIQKDIEKLDKKLNLIAKNLDIGFLNYGISPITTYKDISIIPKKRYSIMSKNLPGDHLANMMRETAGIQVSIDYESEEDASRKMKLALKLSPIMTAMFANSPVYDAKLSGYKSFRALSWLFTDNKRCGLISKKLFEKNDHFGFQDYIDIILQIPMLFIIRDNKTIEINQKINFGDFIKHGYENHVANIEDFKLHASLFFPEARINKYIEIRNHDCQKGELKYSIPAIYKGIFLNTHSINETLNLLDEYSYEDFAFARECVPRFGLEATLGKHKIHALAKEIIGISKKYLYKEGKGEHKYLAPIEELLKNNQSPADVIISNWEEKWAKNTSKLIQHITE